jgi:hypothetical protein
MKCSWPTLNAIYLSVIARNQQSAEILYDIGCRKCNLVMLVPDAAQSVTAIVTKAITIIWRCMCCCNTGTHLRHCVESGNHSNGIDSIPCHPTHSMRPYNTALGIYRHAAGENELSAAATQLVSTAWKANFYENVVLLIYTRVRKNQLDAHFILSIFRQPLHVSGVSRRIIRRYNPTYTTVATYYYFWITVCCPGSNQKNSHLKRIISINCCIHTVVPPDDVPIHVRNM